MCSIAYFDATSEAADRLITEFATVEDHADAARHSRLRRRRQTLTVRSLLRAILAREVSASAASPWRLLRGPQGYPDEAVSGTTRRVVSLAHSGTIVACATAPDGMIGVDVERIAAERPVLALAQAAFGPAEVRDVERDGAAAFYRIWTLREALAKASGQGFGLLVNGMDFVPGFTVAGRRRAGGVEWDLACWTLAEGYQMAIARQVRPRGGSTIPPPWNFARRPTPT